MTAPSNAGYQDPNIRTISEALDSWTNHIAVRQSSGRSSSAEIEASVELRLIELGVADGKAAPGLNERKRDLWNTQLLTPV